MTDHALPQPPSNDVAGSPRAIPVSETFYSIQGEGKLTGQPSYFIRTSGCNLRCTWCDTPYASWNPDGSPRAFEDLLAEARSRRATHVVLTGGEPMMFPQTPELTRVLRASGLHVTIETAGTLCPPNTECDLLSLSPKLANSTPRFDPSNPDPRDPKGVWAARHEQRRLNLPVLQQLLDRYPERQLKFVVQAESDLTEIEGLLSQLRGVLPRDVMLMPEGVVTPTPERKSWVAAACVARGWRYCQRLHVELYGNTRGT